MSGKCELWNEERVKDERVERGNTEGDNIVFHSLEEGKCIAEELQIVSYDAWHQAGFRHRHTALMASKPINGSLFAKLSVASLV